jgi:hypothetical protein
MRETVRVPTGGLGRVLHEGDEVYGRTVAAAGERTVRVVAVDPLDIVSYLEEEVSEVVGVVQGCSVRVIRVP